MHINLNIPNNPGLPWLRPLAGCRNIVSGVVVGFLFMGIGVAMFYFMRSSIEQSFTSPSWPTVQGQVIHSEVASHRDSDGDMMYTAVVDYSYSVNGQTYQGSRITLMDGSTSTRGSVEGTVRRYPSGALVTVYYQAADPASSVLEPGVKGFTLLLGVFVLCFPLAGLLAIFGSLASIFRLGRL